MYLGSKKLLSSVLLGLAVFLTGCDKPTVTIEVVGDGDVMASEGYSCIDGANEGPVYQGTISPCVLDVEGEVTFTAVPDDGYVFYGWGYACTGSEPTCVAEGSGGSFTWVPSTSTPITAVFYPQEIADAVDTITTDDFGMRLCIGESMMEQEVTDLADLTVANCELGHAKVWPKSIDLNVLTQVSSLESVSLAPRERKPLSYSRGQNDVVPGLDLSQLNDMPNLQSLTLTRLDAENFDLSSTQLTSLDLSRTNLDHFEFLANLPNLESLVVSSAAMDDESLAYVGNLTALTNLTLESSTFTSVDALAGLTNLVSLRILYTDATDASAFANLTALESLNLQGMEIEDHSFLSNLTNLQYLNLYDSTLDDSSWAFIGGTAFPNMTSLTVGRNPISDLSVLSPVNLPQLAEMNLNYTHVTDVTPLYGFTTLTSLRIGSSRSAEEIISCAVEDELEAAIPGLDVSVSTSTYYVNGELVWMEGCAPVE